MSDPPDVPIEAVEYQINLTDIASGGDPGVQHDEKIQQKIIEDVMHGVKECVSKIEIPQVSARRESDTKLTPRMKSLQLSVPSVAQNLCPSQSCRVESTVVEGRIDSLECIMRQSSQEIATRLEDLETHTQKMIEIGIKQHATTTAVETELSRSNSELKDRIYELETIVESMLAEQEKDSSDTQAQNDAAPSVEVGGSIPSLTSSSLNNELQSYTHAQQEKNEASWEPRLRLLEKYVGEVQASVFDFERQYKAGSCVIEMFVSQAKTYASEVDRRLAEHANLFALLQQQLNFTDLSLEGISQKHAAHMEINEQNEQRMKSLDIRNHVHERLLEELKRRFHEIEKRQNSDRGCLEETQNRLNVFDLAVEGMREKIEAQMKSNEQIDQRVLSLDTCNTLHQHLLEEVNRGVEEIDRRENANKKSAEELQNQLVIYEKKIEQQMQSIELKMHELSSAREEDNCRSEELRRIQETALSEADKLGKRVNVALADVIRLSQQISTQSVNIAENSAGSKAHVATMDEVVSQLKLLTQENNTSRFVHDEMKQEIQRLHNWIAVYCVDILRIDQEKMEICRPVHETTEALAEQVKAIRTEIERINGLSHNSDAFVALSVMRDAASFALTAVTLTQNAVTQSQNSLQDCRNLQHAIRNEYAEHAQNYNTIKTEILQNCQAAQTETAQQYDTVRAEIEQSYSAMCATHIEIERHCAATKRDRAIVEALISDALVVSKKRRMMDEPVPDDQSRKSTRFAKPNISNADQIYESIEQSPPGFENDHPGFQEHEPRRVSTSGHVHEGAENSVLGNVAAFNANSNARTHLTNRQSSPKRHRSGSRRQSRKRLVVEGTVSPPAIAGQSRQPRPQPNETRPRQSLSASSAHHLEPPMRIVGGNRRVCAVTGCVRFEAMVKSTRVLTEDERCTPWFCPDHGVVDGDGSYTRTTSMVPI